MTDTIHTSTGTVPADADTTVGAVDLTAYVSMAEFEALARKEIVLVERAAALQKRLDAVESTLQELVQEHTISAEAARLLAVAGEFSLEVEYSVEVEYDASVEVVYDVDIPEDVVMELVEDRVGREDSFREFDQISVDGLGWSDLTMQIEPTLSVTGEATVVVSVPVGAKISEITAAVEEQLIEDMPVEVSIDSLRLTSAEPELPTL